MNVLVIGSGYVGTVTGACLAELGHRVICADNDEAKVRRLEQGEVDMYEPGLSELIQANLARKTLSFTTATMEAVRTSSIIFLAVGTPSRPDGSADLSAVESVAAEVAAAADSPKLLVIKSTVPVGTCRRIQQLVDDVTGARVVEIASSPEFLQEGRAVRDFMEPDRVVVGTESPEALEALTRLFQPFAERGVAVVSTTLESAEMIKYASNVFLATKISYVNEIANICSRVGADIEEVARGMGYDPRIGPLFLRAGIGYGGSCLPKDIKALIHSAQQAGYRAELLESVKAVNDRQLGVVVEMLREALGSLEGRTVAVLGLAFKSGTNDLRESRGVALIEELLPLGATVRAYDPLVNGLSFPKGEYGEAASIEEAVRGADAVVITTEHEGFKQLAPEALAGLMRTPVVVDGRNLLRWGATNRVRYVRIGRRVSR